MIELTGNNRPEICQHISAKQEEIVGKTKPLYPTKYNIYTLKAALYTTLPLLLCLAK